MLQMGDERYLLQTEISFNLIKPLKLWEFLNKNMASLVIAAILALQLKSDISLYKYTAISIRFGGLFLLLLTSLYGRP